MNLLLSIFILLLSSALFCSSEQIIRDRSGSTDTVDMCYRIIDNSTKDQNNRLTTELEATISTLELVRFDRDWLIQKIKTMATEKANLNSEIRQLQQRISNYENEEIVDLSCSIVGPKFHILPCFTSQPLPRHIEARKAPMSSRSGESLHYYNTKTQTPICELQSSDCCDRCFLCLCCIQRKLPYNLGIRSDNENSQSKFYYDKNDDSMRELEGVGGWTYQSCCERFIDSCCCSSCYN